MWPEFVTTPNYCLLAKKRSLHVFLFLDLLCIL